MVAVACGRWGRRFLLAGGASAALHLLLGWGLVQLLQRTDTRYAGQVVSSPALLATLHRALPGYGVPQPPHRPVPQTPAVQHSPVVPVVAARPATHPAGLDPGSRQPQEGFAGDEGDVSATAADPYGDYLPANSLDIVPMPVTAPDSRDLDGMTLSVSPVDVRLYVDATGAVRKVVVQVPEAEQASARPLREMFRNTRFVPGRRQGKAVPSVLALRIRLSDLLSIRRFD